MSQRPQPSLVFVHGAWHNPSCWDKVIAQLDDQHFKSIAVELPSCTSGNPATTFLDDITVVRDAILSETTQGRDVVVVVHSYGGMIGSSAIKGLSRNTAPKPTTTTLNATGNAAAGHVIGLIYLASGFNAANITFLGGFNNEPPPIWRLDIPTGFAVLTVDPRELFYHDLPQAEGELWVSKLEKMAIKPMVEGGEFSYEGWMDVPVRYLVTTEDKALPAEVQRMFVAGAREKGADVRAGEVESGHSPMLSKVEETTGFILEAVDAFVR